jgi:hypothetical protein
MTIFMASLSTTTRFFIYINRNHVHLISHDLILNKVLMFALAVQMLHLQHGEFIKVVCETQKLLLSGIVSETGR